MMWRKLCTAVAAVALVAGFALPSAYAKKCPKICKPEITACRSTIPDKSTCTGTRKEKGKCRRAINKAKRVCMTSIIKACKQRKDTVPATVCSPSGAFLDLVE